MKKKTKILLIILPILVILMIGLGYLFRPRKVSSLLGGEVTDATIGIIFTGFEQGTDGVSHPIALSPSCDLKTSADLAVLNEILQETNWHATLEGLLFGYPKFRSSDLDFSMAITIAAVIENRLPTTVTIFSNGAAIVDEQCGAFDYTGQKAYLDFVEKLLESYFPDLLPFVLK